MSIRKSIFGRSSDNQKSRAQGLVEFALILPVMLIVIFVIVELARVLHAWLAVENGARFGVRYAVTGEFDPANCVLLYGGPCLSESQEDGARIPSIKDVAQSGAVAILKDDTVGTVGTPGFFNVTVCSSKSGIGFFESDSNTPTAASCTPAEDAGDPGDRVIVAIDFDHPLITPMISTLWPDLHLTAKREGIVEQFRTARVVGLPATAGPSPTPSNTPTPTFTVTPTSSATATNTPTPSDTPTPSNTPTVTPTPDCSNIYISSFNRDGNDEMRARVRNYNMADATLISTTFTWQPWRNGSAYVDWFRFSYRYWNGNSSSATIGPIGSSVNFPGNSSITWRADFDNQDWPIWGNFGLTLVFDYADWAGDPCTLTANRFYDEPAATNTPGPTNTTGPSNTPGPTKTPKPTTSASNTPKPSASDTPKPPASDTPVPTDTEGAPGD
jgi:cell division septation protein DedD